MSAHPSLDDALSAELEALEARHLRRRLPDPRPTRGARLRPWEDDRNLVVLGSNDYLGLARHSRVVEAAARAAREWGAGATGSRLLTGNFELHTELEAALARLKGTDDALLFPSGYQAAVGTIPALVGRGDLILSDALNHACLIDGCRLSRAEVRVYRHSDAGHARTLLADRDRFRRCLLVTDGVFSMDGDLAPLPALAAVCDESDAWLLVDDAHGTAVLGPTGAGTAEHLGVSGRVAIQMGTLSKALASQGGFIAGSSVLIEYLRNRARSFIFSTGSAPATAAAALAALETARSEPERRARVHALARRLRDGLRSLGFDVSGGETPIVPIVLGESEQALRAAGRLRELGCWIPAIRPPTVPDGTARLRAGVTAAHTEADLAAVLAAFARLRAEGIA